MTAAVTDDALLASLGYKQGPSFFYYFEHATTIELRRFIELKRNFTPLEVFGIGFSVIGLIPSMASVVPTCPL
jgi:hypothetical protein